MADYRMMILAALFAFLSGQGFSMDYSMTKRLDEDRECRSCNLEAGNLAGVQFINFDLSNANLAKAHLEGSNFNNSNLAGINLQGAHLFSALCCIKIEISASAQAALSFPGVRPAWHLPKCSSAFLPGRACGWSGRAGGEKK